MTTGPTLTIVQLTDCHLFTDPDGSLRDIETRPRLRRAIEHILSRVPDFDLLVVTGDTAHDEAQATYDELHAELGDWVDRLRIVPGNHDDRTALRRVFPAATEEIGGRVGFCVERDDWLVIGLDSQRTGEDAGELGSGQLAWLDGRLAADPARSVVLFLHHPPIAVGSPWVDRIGLLDAEALDTVLARHPRVRAVVTGHVHQEASGRCGNADVHTSPAVGPQFRPHTETLVIDPGPPAYRIIELHPTGDWSTTVVRCPPP
jgi:3',5'-cyclic-AMP phosphodiesterase